MTTPTPEQRKEAAQRAWKTRIRERNFAWITVKASEVAKAFERGMTISDDWQAQYVEVLFIPKVNKRWLEANPNLTLVLERVDGKPHKGFTPEDNGKVGDRDGWLEFAGYQLRYGEHYGWNSARADWYAHSPSTTWDGIERDTYHQFVQDLGYAVKNILDGKSPHPATIDNLRKYHVKLVNDLSDVVVDTGYSCAMCGSFDRVKKAQVTYGELNLCEICRVADEIERNEQLKSLPV